MEAVLPESTVLIQPLGGIFHRICVKTQPVFPSPDFPCDDPGVFEDAKVFGDSREGYLKVGSDFRDIDRTLCQQFDDSPSGWTRKGPEYTVERGIVIFNHMVKYIYLEMICQGFLQFFS